MPAAVVGDVVEDELAGAEGVEGLQGDGCDHSAYEGGPHGFVWEVGGELLEGEEDAADGGAEGDGDPACGCSGQGLALAGFVGVKGGEGTHEEVGAAAGDVHEGAFLAEPHSGGDGEAEAEGFD